MVGLFFFNYFIVPQCSPTLSLCKRTETTAMINTSSSHRSLWVLTLKPNYVNLSVGIVNLFSAIHFNKTAVFPTIRAEFQIADRAQIEELTVPSHSSSGEKPR